MILAGVQAGGGAIGCKVGGRSDLIVHGSTGWLIEPHPSELAEFLLRLAHKPEDLVAAGEQAQQLALAYFSQASFDQALAGSLQSC